MTVFSSLISNDLQAYVKQMLDAIPMPLIVSQTDPKDKNNRLHIHLNRSFIKEFGYTIDTLPDIRSWFEVAYPDINYREEINLAWEESVKNANRLGYDTAELPALICDANNKSRWYMVTAQINTRCRSDIHVVAFKNIHEYKITIDEKEKLSITDPLTQLMNRRGYAYWKETLNLPLPITALLIDIDKFKNINDKYGHDAGDHVIRHVASVIKRLSPEASCCVRWGGEEFLILIHSSDTLLAEHIAEKIRIAIESEILLWCGISIPITVSAGLAHNGTFTEIDATINLADKALLKSKDLGRNKVTKF